MKDLVRDHRTIGNDDGPLDFWRKRASFDWKSMKLHLYGEQCLDYQNKLCRLIETNPVFKKPSTGMNLDATRRRCIAQMKVLADNDFAMPELNGYFNAIFPYDGSLPIITGLTYGMVPGVIMSLGSSRHSKFLEKMMSGEYRGCFALTEIGHGSNIKGMRTIATYDPKIQSFVLNSPDFEAAKCWAGCLGKLSTHALIFAQLKTPDGVNHGLNVFVVQIRDPKTMLPMPGVTVGDLGEKIGLNGVDNGFLMFDNYRVPRENLLNRIVDVSVDGKFLTSVKDSSKRFGASLGSLSLGRVNITNISANCLAAAVTIATRYCFVRKQFGPSDGDELIVIEYQTLNSRLMPLVAMTYAVTMFSSNFVQWTREFRMKMLDSNDKSDLGALGLEIHALSSATKPVCSWLVRDAIQECREACGGHGYLKVSRLGDLKNDHDANCTYEGENNVLIQQSSNWLLSLWPKISQSKNVDSPLGSIDFLKNGVNVILRRKFAARTTDEAMRPEKLAEAFEWLVCYYLVKTQKRVEQFRNRGHDDWTSKNDSQMFHARTLALVYGERAVFDNFCQELNDPKWKSDERAVLTKLCSLYGAWSLEKHLGDLYSGGYATEGSNMSEFIRQGIVDTSRQLVDEAMALVDVFSPPDSFLQSPLGMADGKVYKHLEATMLGNKDNLKRPEWWKEMLPSKL